MSTTFDEIQRAITELNTYGEVSELPQSRLLGLPVFTSPYLPPGQAIAMMGASTLSRPEPFIVIADINRPYRRGNWNRPANWCSRRRRRKHGQPRGHYARRRKP